MDTLRGRDWEGGGRKRQEKQEKQEEPQEKEEQKKDKEEEEHTKTDQDGGKTWIEKTRGACKLAEVEGAEECRAAGPRGINQQNQS